MSSSKTSLTKTFILVPRILFLAVVSSASDNSTLQSLHTVDAEGVLVLFAVSPLHLIMLQQHFARYSQLCKQDEKPPSFPPFVSRHQRTQTSHWLSCTSESSRHSQGSPHIPWLRLISSMPSYYHGGPHHCPGGPGNCASVSGFCKTHQVFCNIHADTYFLMGESCPACGSSKRVSSGDIPGS